MILLLILIFILGSAVGSFLNVVIDRSTRRESILGRSYCDHCKATLSTIDLIPIVSFATLGARCRYCKKKLSFQYPVVETITGTLFVLTFLNLATQAQLSLLNIIYYFVVISTVVVVAAVDVKFSLIPTTIVYVSALISLFYNYFALPSELFMNHIFAAFLGALFFALIVLLTKGRGMGQGDIIFAFFMGMALGLSKVSLAIFIAFLLGALISMILVILGRKKFGQTIPFAPFLAIGFLLSLFWGQRIIEWYLMIY